MTDLQTVEKRLENAGTLQDVVHAMRSQAAVYYRSAEAALEPIRAWERRVRQCLGATARNLPHRPTPGRGSGPAGLVVLSSDQGLCGAFNDRILEYVLSGGTGEAWRDAVVMTVGHRGADLMRVRGLEPERVDPAPTSLEGIHRAIQTLAVEILRIFEERGLARLKLCFNVHQGPGRFQPDTRTVLPLDLDRLLADVEEPFPGKTMAVQVPRLELIRSLTREHFFILLYGSMVESYASENGARLSAMEAAMSNIEEKVVELTGLRNRLRQESITQEVLEIASGAAAVMGGEEG